MECERGVMNQVKAFLVWEFEKYFIFKFSLFAISYALVRYRAMCSIVGLLVSPENLVNFGTFHPLGSSTCNTYSDRAYTKFGLCRLILSRLWARMFWPYQPNYFSLLSFLLNISDNFLDILVSISGITLELFWPIYSSSSLYVRGFIGRNPNCARPWLI